MYQRFKEQPFYNLSLSTGLFNEALLELLILLLGSLLISGHHPDHRWEITGQCAGTSAEAAKSGSECFCRW